MFLMIGMRSMTIGLYYQESAGRGPDKVRVNLFRGLEMIGQPVAHNRPGAAGARGCLIKSGLKNGYVQMPKASRFERLNQ